MLNTLRWNCFQTRQGEGKASSTRPHPVAPRQKWVTGRHWGSMAKGARTFPVHIHTERHKAVSGTPTSANDLVQIEFKRGRWGNRVTDALSLSSKEKTKGKKQKVAGKDEEEEDRREMMVMDPSRGGGLVPGWCGWWSPRRGQSWP